jgi:hypothetical protein
MVIKHSKSAQPARVWPNYTLSMVHGIVIPVKNGANYKYPKLGIIL